MAREVLRRVIAEQSIRVPYQAILEFVAAPNLWAYAEHSGLPEILSEDFEDRRLYGSVRIRNPFVS
jgi:hypothetical protein